MKLTQSFLVALDPSTRFFYGETLTSYAIETINECPFLKNDKEYTVSINSKEIISSDFFLAHKGNKIDSHDFLHEALSNNAAGLIIAQEKEQLLSSIPSPLLFEKFIISVPNTLFALVSLAKKWRTYFSYPVVAITGSLGKTTTKEMIRSILNVSNTPACISRKSYNSIIGLPISILSMSNNHKVAIFEVGITMQGEMKELVEILQPTMAVITSLSHMHTEGLGSLSKLAAEKKLIFSTLETTGIGIIPGDNTLLSEASYPHPLVRFGKKTKNQIQARKIEYHPCIFDEKTQSFGYITFVLKLYNKKIPITLHSESPAMVTNALAASSVCHLLNINPIHIAQGLASFRPVLGRFKKEILAKTKSIIINDCYNAGPESMKNALVGFNHIPFSGKRIIILGEMRELGSKEHFWHRKIGRELCKVNKLDHLILVGSKTKSIAKTAPLFAKSIWLSSWQDAYSYLQQLPLENNLILIKGSNGVGLLNLVNKLVELHN